jgi:hypothetical protein
MPADCYRWGYIINSSFMSSHILFNEIDTPMKTAPRINFLTVRFQFYLPLKSFDSNVLAKFYPVAPCLKK